MQQTASENGGLRANADTTVTERVVYVTHPNSLSSGGEDSIDFLALWETLWAGKLFIICATALIGIVTITYAFFATKWYRAEVVLIPAAQRSSQTLQNPLGGLGGLASLVGVSVGAANTTEPLAVLRSREFTRTFIQEELLLPTLFEKQWDAKAGNWRNEGAEKEPDIRDAIQAFEHIRGIQEDRKNGLITLSIEWTDPVVAALWANKIVERLNERMRQQALKDAEANVKFLQEELNQSSVVALQQSIGRLIESEMQKVMLARGNKDFAFRYIDHAEPPKRAYRPRRLRAVALSIVIGGFLSSAVVLLRASLRGARASKS